MRSNSLQCQISVIIIGLRKDHVKLNEGLETGPRSPTLNQLIMKLPQTQIFLKQLNKFKIIDMLVKL